MDKSISGIKRERLSRSILLVDEDPSSVALVRGMLKHSGFDEPVAFRYPEEALAALDTWEFDVALIDLMLPQMSGTELLMKIKTRRPEMACVIVTAQDEVDSVVDAMRRGAFDYLVKPVAQNRLINTVNKALESADLSRGIYNLSFEEKMELPEAFRRMVCVDQEMISVLRRSDMMAKNDYTVLISGESGTGKELLARAIHDLSHRADGPFIAVNIASIASSLFEDALFGHERGAFTGASERHKGYLEAAEGGTLFLDEISELRYDLQAKLLRVLQEHEYNTVGSTVTRGLRARVITATNRDLGTEVLVGTFRKDLYYRLNTCAIKIPPLRERKRDIIPLASHFLRFHAERCGSRVKRLDHDLIEFLKDYDFPGNVRELENHIISGIVVEPTDSLHLSSIPELFDRKKYLGSRLGTATLEEAEKLHILKALKEVSGNRSKTAKTLGISRSTLQRKLKYYGLEAAASN